MIKAEDARLGKDLEVVRYFRGQFRLISDGMVLDLLERFETKPFMNAEARAIFGNKRQTTWIKLARLVEAGLVQKRGHVYRVSPFAHEFVRGASSVLKHLMTGEELSSPRADGELLQTALEGVEMLYSKGKIGQEVYFRYRKAVEETLVGQRSA